MSSATTLASQYVDAGMKRHREGELAEAEKMYRAAIAHDPQRADALFLLSVLAMNGGQLEAAAELLDRASALAPDNAVYHSNRGDVLRRLGRAEEATDALARAIAIKPDLPEPTYNLALALKAQGEHEPALALFERAADLKPDLFAIQFALAGALRASGRLAQSIGHYQCASVLQPKSVDALIDLGNVLHLLGRLDGAVAAYRRALDVAPDTALAHNNLGNVLMENQQFEDAAACFRRALALEPGFAAAHVNLGNVHKEYAELDEAIASYRRAVAADPRDHAAHANVVYALSFHPGHDARAVLEEAQRWSQQHAESRTPAAPPRDRDRDPERRLRIGYVSPDFRDHCQAFFTLPLLRHHDREHFEIFCYTSGARADSVTASVRDHADAWRSIAGADDAAAAAQIRGDGIDILVDLTMHMANSRLLLFAHKPAPLEVCWLAYPGTTGLAAMDYRITDIHLDPPELAGDEPYAERSYRLPDTFWCYDPLEAPPVAPLPALSNRHVTFGCLNNFCKINDAVLSLWARVLAAKEGSRLLLLAPPGPPREWVRAVFGRAGIAADRLEFVDRRPRQEYLALYHRIDVCLDSFPYNGHTTSLDAFYMGAPVMTRVGRTVVGRAGRCQAMNLGLPELVAESDDEFVRRALDCVRDLERLSALRAGLRDRMRASPLMDAPRFARNLEAAYRAMWRAWCEGGAA